MRRKVFPSRVSTRLALAFVYLAFRFESHLIGGRFNAPTAWQNFAYPAGDEIFTDAAN